MTNDYGNLELHTVLLAAMKDIDRVCRENGLKYYLHAGTLLGAMNHQGFIPWDDDVDISLLREDYEKFLQVMEGQFAERYFVQNFKTDPFFQNNRSVLRVLGTSLVYYHDDGNKSRKEIGLDIVPLDTAPDCPLLRWIQQKEIWILDAAVQIKQGEIIPHHPIMKCISLLSRLDRSTLGRQIDRLCMRYNGRKSKYVGLLSYTGRNPYTGRSGYENDLMLREWYKKPIYVPFEDTEFMTISDPEADLIHRYGPHWHDPYPEEKRVTKHNVKSYYISPQVRERVGL